MSGLMLDGTAEHVSRDQILKRVREQGSIHFPCSADHVRSWQPYPVEPYSCYMCDYTYILPDHLCVDGMDGETIPDEDIPAAVAVGARD